MLHAIYCSNIPCMTDWMTYRCGTIAKHWKRTCTDDINGVVLSWIFGHDIDPGDKVCLFWNHSVFNCTVSLKVKWYRVSFAMNLNGGKLSSLVSTISSTFIFWICCDHFLRVYSVDIYSEIHFFQNDVSKCWTSCLRVDNDMLSIIISCGCGNNIGPWVKKWPGVNGSGSSTSSMPNLRSAGRMRSTQYKKTLT